MSGDSLSKEEVRTIARDEMQPEIHSVRLEIAHLRDTGGLAAKANAEANAATAKAVERLSLIVAGDAELGVDGVVHDVRELKRDRDATRLEKAKIAGIWIGGSTVGLLVVKAGWYLLSRLFERQ